MNRARNAAQSRMHLDERCKELGPVTRYSPPLRGWIKAVREALGITTAQLAKRLGMKQPSVVAIERSEAKSTIELATLRRVAEALDCTLVYASVPPELYLFRLEAGMRTLTVGLFMLVIAGIAAELALIQPADVAGMLATKGAHPVIVQVGPNLLYRGKHIPGAIYAGPGSKPEGLELLKQAVDK